ncbi:CAZyme family GH5 [Agaricus bisporus var. burnettii]|uniref:CAZyme family GH5 n=1 Tax=Agaricus bisporus var. burnettii TaxID=192524 RepID=A0A8H7C272_AGABI|nr:CAZyme family GH5 [Agaricus bisporus var. burnettii]
MSFLRVSGTAIVNDQQEEVVLKGAGLGGWMLMENFISGYPGCEYQIREALADVLGEAKSNFFFDKFLEYFFAEADAKFFKSLGLNCIRIAVNYRHFEDDSNPLQLRANAFTHLDRAIAICAQHSIYTIIDMHSVPGGQSGGWHCDAGTHLPNFWRHKHFQDRLVWLWTVIAERYKDNKWIGGYNLINEPADPSGWGKTDVGGNNGSKQLKLVEVYDRLVEAVRSVDDKHIIFLDGNTFATDFTQFPDDVAEGRWSNAAFSIHDYAIYGFPNSPSIYVGSDEQKERLLKTYERKRKWMDERGLCVWNGEWGPVYARKEYDGADCEMINEARLSVVKDQLEIYRKDKLSWSIWLYKDIGFQGMVHVSQNTPYMKLLKSFLMRKHRLAADAWGKDDTHVKYAYQPIIDLLRSEVPVHSQKLYPPIWSLEERVTRISRTILFAEFMVKEWADHFAGMEEAELDELAKSFSFENCVERQELNHILRADA